MKILVAGELNPDLILQNYRSFPALGKEVLVDDLLLTLGSASAICAVGLARLGNQVSFLTKVGQDTWGDFCLEQMRAAGVDTSLVLRDANVKTGITVSITGAKDRALVTYLGAIISLTAEEISPALFRGFTHLHISSYYLQERLRPGLRGLFAAARAQGLTTSLDPGYDPAEQWHTAELFDTLAEVDVFFPNEVELAALSGESDPERAVRQLSQGRTRIVAKLGANGSLTVENGIAVYCPALPVQPVDTTGAGDSFNAGFLHAWVRRQPVGECLRFGAACGALSTLGMGGTGSQPTETQAQEFIAKGASL